MLIILPFEVLRQARLLVVRDQFHDAPEEARLRQEVVRDLIDRFAAHSHVFHGVVSPRI